MNEAPAVALVGATGWLGEYIRESLPEAVPISATEILDSGGEVLSDLLTGPEWVVVNAAGARQGLSSTLLRLNAELPGILATTTRAVGAHLVHLGSAAEYGFTPSDVVCDESGPARPASEYGRTKLQGTLAALEGGNATVLRVFNVLADPPQDASPLADVAARVRRAFTEGIDADLLSAGTVRDWVRREFVRNSVVYAVANRPKGLFNLSSGTGCSMGEIAGTAMELLGSEHRVRDLEAFPPTVVVGKPDAWRRRSGLAQDIGALEVAEVVSSVVRRAGYRGRVQ